MLRRYELREPLAKGNLSTMQQVGLLELETWRSLQTADQLELQMWIQQQYRSAAILARSSSDTLFRTRAKSPAKDPPCPSTKCSGLGTTLFHQEFSAASKRTARRVFVWIS